MSGGGHRGPLVRIARIVRVETHLMRPLRHVFADQMLRDSVVDALVEPPLLQALLLEHSVHRAGRERDRSRRLPDRIARPVWGPDYGAGGTRAQSIPGPWPAHYAVLHNALATSESPGA